MTIDGYLQGEEAVADLAAALKAGPLPTPRRPSRDGVPVNGGRSFWYLATADAWTGIALCGTDRDDGEGVTYPVRGGTAAAAYFRPDGDRCEVTDLGEAVRAMRRTGVRMALAEVRAVDVCRRLPGNVEPGRQAPGQPLGFFVSVVSGEIFAETMGRRSVVGADLPRAIVRVLLAAHRAANLETP